MGNQERVIVFWALPMESSSQQRVKPLFLELVEASPGERRRRLEACADPRFAAEVCALLMAAHGTNLFFAGLSLSEGAAQLTNSIDRRGSRIDAYPLDAPLDRGGMGEVWSARGADGACEQHVAIKLLTAGVHDADAVARFQAERGILAQLSHPSIAALYDGGALEDEIPTL